MAQKVQVELIDDLDGGPADETVRFSIDGRSYEIDLSAANAKELREGLAEYINAGRKAGAGPRRPAGNSSRNTAPAIPTRDVRIWAADNGYQLADRGRVPQVVLEAYQTANA